MTPAPITTFREAIAEGLAAALAVTFAPVWIDEAQEKDIGCTWPGSISEMPGRVSQANSLVRVRVLRARKMRRELGAALDPTLLETTAALVHAWAEANRRAASWHCRCTSTEFNHRLYAVDFVFLGQGSNPAGGGA